ncbi:MULTISPECIES: FAD-dependent monooxygenase [unclassified Burkholderia]|uniref:FAD-dependent monooxygenase n=1 Tax=unclassified Burkholderia TaxID=2613784 RepID=UPI000F581C9D|nr:MULTISPECIES: FAD-dependent monooxygenase [unclassified Burkholderia]RQR30745.1 monooxygenase [Burkholderia sp. Bp9142]RQR45965.1 monooxygenase [Burkholderia sp. Bp9140]
MKVNIVGGGPSGLFLAILLARHAPHIQTEVIEQNEADATFGFGVVLADTGLTRLHQAAPELCTDLISAMKFTSQQTIITQESPVTVKRPGQGGGAIPRLKLLQILQEHATRLNIPVTYASRINDIDGLDGDIIVGADGVNSKVRSSDEIGFGTTKQELTNHFAWFGVGKAFENPSLVFREFCGGCFVAHYYPYSESMSTFVAECDHETWIKLGLEEMTLEQREALFEEVFATELDGYRLISNNSIWRQFPVIRNANWFSGNRVLVGDALASAHFSIGSGTRIAMEDSIALAQAIVANDSDVVAALAGYVARRRESKDRLIKASEASYMWYENIREWMNDLSPHQFVYQFMTRTGRVDAGRLREQYPALVRELEVAGAIPSIEGLS